MHERSPVFIGPHHTMHYGVKQLQMLMKGFELVHVESYVTELNWISNWLNFKNPEFRDAKLMHELFDTKKNMRNGHGYKIKCNIPKIMMNFFDKNPVQPIDRLYVLQFYDLLEF